MTSAAKTETGDEVRPPEMVTLTIDGIEISVPKGTLVIRAAELMGIQIPRFCDHPLLDPVGACRQCMVEVEGQRKPLASCTITVTDGMVVRTQLTSPAADKAQHGVMELLLINHPLDCPVCDKGGECPLQNQAMSNGRADSRFTDVKRTFAKPINISAQVLLDRERCVLCARCTRFSEQIAGDPFIDMLERGALQQVGIYAERAVRVLLLRQHRADLPGRRADRHRLPVPGPPVRPGLQPRACASTAPPAAPQRTDHRRGKVLRRLAGDDPEVNEEWNCDKGRWAFTYATRPDRITTPADPGRRRHAAYRRRGREALAVAAARASRPPRGRTGVLVGGRADLEDAYAYAKFARIALDTNDIDFRARPHSAEEADFLAARVAGRPITVSYADLESAPVVLLVGFEPEDESPIVFLRLRKAARKHGLPVLRGRPVRHPRRCGKMSGRLLKTAPGPSRRRWTGWPPAKSVTCCPPRARSSWSANAWPRCPAGCPRPRAWPTATGARLAWVPRRAGERGALEAGALPDAAARWPSGGRRRGPRRGRCRLARRRTAHRGRTRRRRHPGRRRRRHAGRTAGRGRGARRLRRSGRGAGRARCGRVRGQPGAAAQRRHRTRRCGVPRRADGARRPAPSSTGRAAIGGFDARAARQRPASRPVGSPGAATRWPTKWASIWARPPSRPPAPSRPGWGRGTANTPPARISRLRARPSKQAQPGRARPCWPAGGCCSTTAACRTANRIWPAPPASRWCGCRPVPRPRSAPPTATRSRSARRAARSPCRWTSPTCPTGWCGCR